MLLCTEKIVSFLKLKIDNRSRIRLSALPWELMRKDTKNCGLWLSENDSVFWLGVLIELKNRRVEDILYILRCRFSFALYRSFSAW